MISICMEYLFLSFYLTYFFFFKFKIHFFKYCCSFHFCGLQYLCLLVGVFRPFIFNIIINMFEVKSTNLLIIFLFLPFILSSFSQFLLLTGSSINIDQVLIFYFTSSICLLAIHFIPYGCVMA